MISRGQVFVRAQDEAGHWGNADVLDLTDDSFKAWVVYVFAYKLGCLVSVSQPEGEEIVLKTKVPFPEGS